MPETSHTMHLDHASLRVTEWTLPPGGATGAHRHGYDYLVVPITHGLLRAVGADGVHETPLVPGKPYFRAAGVEHDVINAGEATLTFIEVELKEHPG
jgi:quercetin dioxygenase-like cupin family protein